MAARTESDEWYLLGIVENLVGEKCQHQSCFDSLRGDPNHKGTCRLLPVDGYFEASNLIVEYYERQHTRSVKQWDSRSTVSGVPRGEQRRLYDQRKIDWASSQGITLLVLDYTMFQRRKRRLVRDLVADTATVKSALREAGVLGDAEQVRSP